MNQELKIIISSSSCDGPSVMILKVLQLFMFFSGAGSDLRGQTDSKLRVVRLSVGTSPRHINLFHLFCQGMKCYFKFLSRQSLSVGGFFDGEIQVFLRRRIYGMCSLPLLLWEEVFGLEDLLGRKSGNKAVGDICALQF